MDLLKLLLEEHSKKNTVRLLQDVSIPAGIPQPGEEDTEEHGRLIDRLVTNTAILF